MKVKESEELEEDEVLLDSDKDENELPVTEEELERTFIEHFPKGCPICRGEVRGNKYYKYFCKKCNLMFERKDIIEKEFGRHLDDPETKRGHRLTDEDRKKLMGKKTELNEKIKILFSDKETLPRPVTKEKKKRPDVSLPPLVIDDEDTTIDDTDIEKEDTDIEKEEWSEGTKEETKKEETEVEIIKPDQLTKLAKAAVLSAPKPQTSLEDEKDETYEDDGLQEGPEDFGTEDPDKIIASKESTKIHMGNCHFVKKIHPENRIYFDSIEKGLEEYDPCVCVRRVLAKQKANKP